MSVAFQDNERSRTFYISSDDRTVSESKSNSDFTIYLKETIDSQQVKRIIVKDITVPNVFYNVRTSYGEVNSEYTIWYGGVPFIANLTEGQYTIDEIITEVASQLNTGIGGTPLTFTRDAKTSKITIASSGSTIQMPGVGYAGNISLGFSVDSAVGASITGDSHFDVSGIQNVYIQSNALAHSNGLDGSFGIVPILDEVSLVNTAYGAYATKENNDMESNEIRYPRLTNISAIDVLLVDRTGNPLPIGVSSMSFSIKTFF